MSQRIVVVGAGPTGLGAGYRLQELGHHDWTVYEKSSHVGGLASSHTDSAGCNSQAATIQSGHRDFESLARAIAPTQAVSSGQKRSGPR